MTTEESYTQKKQTDGSHDFQISPNDCFPIHHSIATTLYLFVSPIPNCRKNIKKYNYFVINY